jgi:hypothetical protein
MKAKSSAVFQLFDQQFSEAKILFGSLSKEMKGRKALELEQRLNQIEIYVHLLSKIHFQEEKLKFKVFEPFNQLKKQLKKVRHLKLIYKQINDYADSEQQDFLTYQKFLQLEKKLLYTETYDLILKTPLKDFDDLYEEVYKYSNVLAPLTINTATTQIINDELGFFQIDQKTHLDTKTLKDIKEGLSTIIALENFRIIIGLNPVYTPKIHDSINDLHRILKAWAGNHLLIQHLTYFLSERDQISKKYEDLFLSLKSNKKKFTIQVEENIKKLFSKIIS